MEIDEKARALNAKALRVWLAEEGKNQGDLAHAIGITQSYLSRLMKGKLRLTGDQLLKVSAATGLAAEKLVVPYTGDVMGKNAKRRRKKRISSAKGNGKQ